MGLFVIRQVSFNFRQALFQAGFTWPRSEDASDQDGRHFVFECETAEGVEEASWET